MKALRTILLAGGALLILAAAAQAADLPTKKTAPAPAPVNCLASFQTWVVASAVDCPLSLYGVTVYGQIDAGASYLEHGAAFGKRTPNPIESVISPQGNGSILQLSDNQLSPSNIGVKVSEALFGDVKFIADWRLSFNPWSLEALSGPGALIDNNGIPAQSRLSVGSGSYNGAWDNNRAFIGFTSPTVGTFKIGRMNTFDNDLFPLYDASGGSYGFSGLGYSGGWSTGLGITETNRFNLGASYVYDYHQLFHVGAGTQIGGFGLENDAAQSYNFDVGGAAGGFSGDLIYQHSTDAIHFGDWSSLPGVGTTPTTVNVSQDLKATMANQDAWAVLAKYNYQAFTIYGTYSLAKLTNPTDTVYANGFSNAEGSTYSILPNSIAPGSISTTAYTIPEILQAASISAKYSVNPQFDVMADYAFVWQENYDTAQTGANCKAYTTSPAGYNGAIPVGTQKPDCAGTTAVVSILFDYRPIKRLDTYVGVEYSTGAGGMVSGNWADNNTAVTAGVRLTF